jgi:Domain of unknown function (DUF892)
MAEAVTDHVLRRPSEWGVRRIRGFPGDGINGIPGALHRIFTGSVGGSMAGDDIVRGATASYIFEHLNITAQGTLVVVGEFAGRSETTRECAEICREDESRADLLAGPLPRVATMYLRRAAPEMEEARC